MLLGTRLRNIHGPRLDDLEAQLETLPFKVEIKGINLKPNGEWYIHFCVEDNVILKLQNEQGTEQALAGIENKNKPSTRSKK